VSVTVAHVRVRYPEVDRMKVAHHSHYYVWFEIARTELMRERGVPYAQLEAEGIFFPVIESGAEHMRAARYDEMLRVEAEIEKIAGVRVTFRYRVFGEEGGRPIAAGFTTHACTNAQGGVARIPEWVRRRLGAGTDTIV